MHNHCPQLYSAPKKYLGTFGDTYECLNVVADTKYLTKWNFVSRKIAREHCSRKNLFSKSWVDKTSLKVRRCVKHWNMFICDEQHEGNMKNHCHSSQWKAIKLRRSFKNKSCSIWMLMTLAFIYSESKTILSVHILWGTTTCNVTRLVRSMLRRKISFPLHTTDNVAV